MKIQPVIFSHAPDADCLIQCVRRLNHIGHPPLVVDSERSPLPLATVSQLSRQMSGLRARGIQYGRHELGNVVRAELEVARDTGADYILKVDSDTIVVRMESMVAAANSGVACAGWAWQGWEFSGSFALIRVDVLEEIVRILDNGLPLPHAGKFDDSNCPEDVTIGRVAATIGKCDVQRFNPQRARGAGYQFHEAKAGLAEYAKRFDSVTFGQRYMLFGSDERRRRVVARMMSAFNHLLKTP